MCDDSAHNSPHSVKMEFSCVTQLYLHSKTIFRLASRSRARHLAQALEDLPAEQAKAKLPLPKVAGRLAVETWFFDRPLGYHLPGHRYAEVVEWCPEAALLWCRESPDSRPHGEGQRPNAKED